MIVNKTNEMLDDRFLVSMRTNDIDTRGKAFLVQQLYNRDLSSSGGKYSTFFRISVEGHDVQFRVDGGAVRTGVEEIELTSSLYTFHALVNWDYVKGVFQAPGYIDGNQINCLGADQNLNTTDDVKFNKVTTDEVVAKKITTEEVLGITKIQAIQFELPEGIGQAPSDLKIGDAWVDRTDGTIKIKME